MARSFDLKAALSGEPVMWPEEKVPMAFVSARVSYGLPELQFRGGLDSYAHVDADGRGRANPSMQLVMAPHKVKKTVYINLYGEFNSANGRMWRHYCSSEAAYINGKDAIATFGPVEIEVEE